MTIYFKKYLDMQSWIVSCLRLINEKSTQHFMNSFPLFWRLQINICINHL